MLSSLKSDVCPIHYPKTTTSAVLGVAVGIGTYVALRKSDLQIVKGWDLRDNRWFVPSVSLSIGLLSSMAIGGLTKLLSNRSV